MSRAKRRSSSRRSVQDDDDDSDIRSMEEPRQQRFAVESDDDEEEEGDDAAEVQFTQQAPEASQPLLPVKAFERTNIDNLSRDAKQKAVTDLSRLLLFKALAGETIDKRKCAKEAFKDHSSDRITSAAFEEAASRLEDVFGFELRRVPKFMEERKNFPAKFKERLYIVNGLEDEEGGTHSKAIHSVHSEEAIGKGLLMIILAFAFCKGEPRGDGARWITDKDLYRLLNGLDENIPAEPPAPSSRKQDKVSRHAGGDGTPNVDDLLEKFVHLDYLLKDKDDKNGAASQTDEICFVYSMGPRAAMEIGRKQVISFCAEILDEEPDPTMLAEIEDGDDEGELMEVAE